jgi:hypothetical protein
MRRAPAGSEVMRALIELRLLKRKCGWIWARSACSSASRETSFRRRASVSARRDASTAART